LFFAGEHASQAMHAYQRLTTDAPDELTSSIAFLRMPDIPAVPEFLRGKLTVNIRISYLGPESEGARLTAPLRAAAPVVMDTVAVRPYTEYATISPGPTEPGASVDQFAPLSELSPAAADAILEIAGPRADCGITIVDVRQLGGALGRQAGTPNAIGHRDAAFVVFTVTVVPPGADADETSGMELIDRLQPWLSGRTHPNFLSRADATVDRTRLAYDAPVYERLQSVKRAFDPGNMFRFNHNIPPGADNG
jgi:hypothetical protein